MTVCNTDKTGKMSVAITESPTAKQVGVCAVKYNDKIVNFGSNLISSGL